MRVLKHFGAVLLFLSAPALAEAPSVLPAGQASQQGSATGAAEGIPVPFSADQVQGRSAPPSGPKSQQELGPGTANVMPVPLTPEQAEARQAKQKAAKGDAAQSTDSVEASSDAQVQAMRTAGGTSAQAPLSITELARALKNDPDLIYQYVRDNIETYPIWGIQKGALGALIDGQGTAWDQVDLMVKLLKAANYQSALYTSGEVELTPAQITSFYGIPTTNACAVRDYFLSGGIPIVLYTQGGTCDTALTKIRISHVWVRVRIGGSSAPFYEFDPAHKPHAVKPGIDLNAATGYTQAGLMTAAGVGGSATVNANYVQNLNRDGIRNKLTEYSNNLIDHIRSNVPAADLDDVIGGKVIIPNYDVVSLRQTVLPYRLTSSYTASSILDDSIKVKLRVQYQGIDQTFRSDEIYGQRLSISFNSSNRPELRLNGALKGTAGTAATPGSPTTITFTVTHNAYDGVNQGFSQPLKAGGTYVISNGWGPTGRGLVELFHGSLAAAKATGAADTSEAVLGWSLATLSANWLAKTDMAAYVADRIAGTTTTIHHQVGIAGHDGAPYVDLPGNRYNVVHQTGDAAKASASFYATATHLSIFESNAVRETSGVSAVSTAKLVDMAVAAGYKIFDAKAANYASAVQPDLDACGTYTADFQSRVNAGARLILPEHCDLAEASWTGMGYFDIRTTGGGTSIGSLISGGLHGGLPTTTLPPLDYNEVALDSLMADVTVTYTTYVDPIDAFTGHFIYGHHDITTGVGNFPYSLTFQSLYNSGNRQKCFRQSPEEECTAPPLGKGWTHNFAMTVKAGVDGLQGLGEDSPIDGATTIAEMVVSLDLLTKAAAETELPLTDVVIATIAQRWLDDQLIDNTVLVTQGQASELFVKLPDGSYNAPPGSSAKLVKNGGATFTYSTADKILMNFDSAGNIVNWIYPNGVHVQLVYDSSGKLVSVVNSLGRNLTLSYIGENLSSVSDGNRSVFYSIDGNGNLTRFTDAASKVTTFTYDLPGRMTQFFTPQNPAHPAMINTYDELGRVQTQTSSIDKVWTYYFAGGRSEEVAPDNARLIHYFDANGRVLVKIDNLLVGDPIANGRKIVNTLDGQGRITDVNYPEGNKLKLVYDDASCASVDKRCTHNVKERRLIAKPGGGADIVTSFTYETNFNKVLTSTDAKEKVTEYDYDPVTGNLNWVKLPAATAGGTRPQTTFGYTSFAGANGLPSFTLPTSVTKKIDASTTTVVTTAYKPAANFFVPASSTVDPSGLNLTTTFTYDTVGNMTDVDGPRTDVTDVTHFSFDGERRLTQVLDAEGKLTKLAYDADGNLQRTTRQAPAGQWQATCKTYSYSGKVTQVRGPALVANDQTCPGTTAPVAVSDFAYDDQDRLKRITQRQPAGQGGNRVTETVYYPDDKVKQVKRAVGSAVAQDYATYVYTANGLPLTLTDAKNQRTTYVYDEFDRLKALRYPTKNGVNASAPCSITSYTVGDDCEVYSYDANGNLLSKRTRAGQTIAFEYDDLNRVKKKTRPDAVNNVGFEYDLLGRPTLIYQDSASVQRHPIAFDYDGAGRLEHLIEDGWTTDYEYDAAGNRKLIRYPYQGTLGSPTNDNFYVTYDYDALNRLTDIRERGAASGVGVLAHYDYDELSRPTLVTLGNGTKRTISYNSYAGVETVGLNLDGAATANDNLYTLAYNQIPQVHQLTSANAAFSWSGYSDVVRPYEVNGLNQYTLSGTKTLSYDDGSGKSNGNLTGDQTWTFGYTPENELIAAAQTGVALAYRYDALGRLDRRQLNSQTATDYRYDGQSLIAEHAPGASPQAKRYVHGGGIDNPLVQYTRQTDGSYTRTWFAADFKGSIVATTNDAGTTTAIYSYGDYGEPNTFGGPSFRYTGQRLDPDSGLYYYKARWYSPNLGRFLSTDPIGTADDVNLYAYVKNDPVNSRDPSGAVAVGWAFDGEHHCTTCLNLGDPGYEDSINTQGHFDENNQFVPVEVNTGGLFPGLTSDGLHNYDITVPLCMDCTTAEGFEAMRHFSAPGAPYAESGTHDLMLSGGNPIRQTVDVEAMTIVNETLPGHTFGGQVSISMEEANGVVSARIVGSGYGPNAGLNELLGPVIFRGLGVQAHFSLNQEVYNLGP